MKVDGTCHCGSIRYEAEVDPGGVVICHCTDCQTLSGSAFRTVVATLPGTFRLLAGTPSTYIKTADSGNRREQTFCPECGTPIYSAVPGDGRGVVSLRVGVLRQRNMLVPGDQFWHRSAQPWLERLRGIPHRDRQPVFGADGSFTSRSQDG